MLFACVRRAGIPHAILRRVDISKAEALPGVTVVLTAKDLPGAHTHGLMIQDWPVLVGEGERVRYEGDAIAILAAETQAAANQAVVLIEAEFERLPVVTGAGHGVGAGPPPAALSRRQSAEAYQGAQGGCSSWICRRGKNH